MRICFVRSNVPEIETRAQNILDALSEFKVERILWDRSGARPANKHEYLYKRTAGFGASSFLFMPFWGFFVFRTLVRLKPDVVHACNIESGIPAVLYAKISRKKLIYDIWDAGSAMLGGAGIPAWIMNWIERGVVKRADAVLLPDAERTEQLGYENLAALPVPTYVIPNSVSLKGLKKTTVTFPRKPLRLLYIGTLVTEIRGLEHLFEAARTVPGLEVTVAGYGPAEETIRSWSAALPNTFKFVGKVSREAAGKLMAETDLVVSLLDPNFSNYRYATSTKAYEAFAAGKPVITTEGTATGRMVAEAGWGFVVPFEAEALEQLITKLQTQKEDLVLNPAKIKNYDWEKAAATLQDLYQAFQSS